MAVPRHSHTRSKTGKHRMHLYIEPALLQSCKKCGKPVLPHTICRNCGFYKGRQAIDVLSKLSKKEQKTRQQDMKQKEKTAKTEPTMQDLSKK